MVVTWLNLCSYCYDLFVAVGVIVVVAKVVAVVIVFVVFPVMRGGNEFVAHTNVQ